MPDPTPPTLKDVAKRAGVSIATASIALSGRTSSAQLSSTSISKVKQAAKDLGYRGNYHARALASGHTFALGVATASSGLSLIDTDYYNAIIGGVEAAARARGYDMLVIGGTAVLDTQVRAWNYLEERRLDALILMRVLYDSIHTVLQQTTRPVVVLQGTDLPNMPGVIFDEEPGIVEAISHLKQLGHRTVCWVSESHPMEDSPEMRRFRTVTRLAAEHALAVQPLLLPEPSWDPKDLRTQIERSHASLVQMPLPAATAFMCYNDALALAVAFHLMNRGITIPGQASIIGFDDRYASLMVPGLTSISHEQRLLGETCANLALDMVDGLVAPVPVPQLRIPSRLIVRGSTGPCRPG